MAITIAPATSADAAALLRHLACVGAETDNLSFGGEGLPMTVEAEAAYLEQLAASQDAIMLLAKEDGEVVGDASLSRLPRRMCHRGELGIAVRRSHWNRGVGSLLMDALLDFARRNTFERLELQVRSDNLSAIHLYEKYGFRKLYTDPAFFKIDGREIAFDFMVLDIN